MTLKEELSVLVNQECQLQFEHFDETVAYKLGCLIYQRAVDSGWPLVIDVRRFDRALFLAARPGVTLDNHDWVRRKSNTVQRFLCSSYRMRYQLAIEQKDIAQRYLLPPSDFASFGGSFPIAVKRAGVIGSVTVSGLPDRQDHQIIVDALCTFLGVDARLISLSPNDPF